MGNNVIHHLSRYDAPNVAARYTEGVFGKGITRLCTNDGS